MGPLQDLVSAEMQRSGAFCRETVSRLGYLESGLARSCLGRTGSHLITQPLSVITGLKHQSTWQCFGGSILFPSVAGSAMVGGLLSVSTTSLTCDDSNRTASRRWSVTQRQPPLFSQISVRGSLGSSDPPAGCDLIDRISTAPEADPDSDAFAFCCAAA